MAKKQITYYHKIRTTSDPGRQLYNNTMDPTNSWRKQVEKTIQETNIDVEDLIEKNHQQAKKYITSKLRKHQMTKIYKAAENKSKVRDNVCHKTTETVATKPNYMSNLTRWACSNIFNTRARMIKVKGNYRNKYNDMSCRWCKEDDETQIHILNHCPEFKAITNNIKHEVYYRDDRESTLQAATTLQEVIEKNRQRTHKLKQANKQKGSNLNSN